MKVIKNKFLLSMLSLMGLLSSVSINAVTWPWSFTKPAEPSKTSQSSTRPTTPPAAPARQHAKESENVNNSPFIKEAVRIITSDKTKPWSVLGVAQNATQADIKAAFRRLTLRYAPGFIELDRDYPRLKSIIQKDFGITNTDGIYKIISVAYGKIGFNNESPFIKNSIRIFVGARPWEILGIGESATKSEATRAYRDLARIYHSDYFDAKKNKEFVRLEQIMKLDFDATDMDIFFKKINTAHQAMSK